MAFSVVSRFVHKYFLFNLKFARAWDSAKFDGQRVEKNYPLRPLF
jgi:ribosome-interacting GTPase 1